MAFVMPKEIVAGYYTKTQPLSHCFIQIDESYVTQTILWKFGPENFTVKYEVNVL